MTTPLEVAESRIQQSLKILRMEENEYFHPCTAPEAYLLGMLDKIEGILSGDDHNSIEAILKAAGND